MRDKTIYLPLHLAIDEVCIPALPILISLYCSHKESNLWYFVIGLNGTAYILIRLGVRPKDDLKLCTMNMRFVCFVKQRLSLSLATDLHPLHSWFKQCFVLSK